MAKKEDRRSRSDRNAERRGVPGRDRQVPTDTTGIYMGGEHIANVDMNFRGLMGGLPTTDARELRRAAAFGRDTGATDSARAAETRARNVEGHDRMTRTARQAVQEEKRMADARAREAAAAKRRAKRPKYAKGGKVTRGDGICKKGHTKGKMV